MNNNNFKPENYRFVLQQCDECGTLFPVVYQFEERTIVPLGSVCEHIPGSTYAPVDGQPTFKEWYENQVRVRSLLAAHA